MVTLYRCPNPTNRLCACGKAARNLERRGIEHDEIRVAYSRRKRPEIEELTGQRWVPLLVHGEHVIHDSKRIVEYLEYLDGEAQRMPEEATA